MPKKSPTCMSSGKWIAWDLLAQSDFVVVAVPYTDWRPRMIGAADRQDEAIAMLVALSGVL